MMTIRRLGYHALRYTSRIPSRRKSFLPLGPLRLFHVTPIYNNDLIQEPSKPFVFDVSALSPNDRHTYNLLSSEDKIKFEEEAKLFHEYMNSPKVESELNSEVSQALAESAQQFEPAEIKIPRIKVGLMAMGEDEEQESGEDDEFEGDDITSLAHAELEQHREMREYARIAAWEMPMLSKLAKPYCPPALDHPLRFRYTTYMGETHPASKKIVLEFCTRDLPDLSEAHRIKLIKLVGPRYNPETDIVKMSCEMFETQAQNKRYLGDLVDTLMTEAKDSSDTFEDIPLDFRHHKFNPPPEFPDSWKLTNEKKQQLQIDRQQRLLAEQKGQITDGVQIIEAALKAVPVVDPKRALLEKQQGKGKGSSSRRKPIRN